MTVRELRALLLSLPDSSIVRFRDPVRGEDFDVRDATHTEDTYVAVELTYIPDEERY